jgi:hypothetical protein
MQKKSECRKFMYGRPRYFPHLVELFLNTAIDGSTSTIPRVSNFDAPGDVGDEEVDNEGNELGSHVSAP